MTTDESLKAAMEASLGLGHPIRDGSMIQAPSPDWPDPASVAHDYVGTWPNRIRCYKSLTGAFEGLLPGVTNISDWAGSKEGLIKWAAETELEAAIEAAVDTYAESEHDGPGAFGNAVRARIGTARKHVREKQKAADIGTMTHQAIHAFLRDGHVDTSSLPEPAQWAEASFEDWWSKSGLKPVRMEQPLWSTEHEFGCTPDIIAQDPNEGLGIVEVKSSKRVFENHHLQVSGQIVCARNWADIRWAKIVRVPKKLDDPSFEVRDSGDMYDEELELAFLSILEAWKVLVWKKLKP